MTVQVSADNPVARRLQTLARLYQQGQASEVMDRTLDKLLSYERDRSQAQLGELRADLAEFERRYQISSVDFYQRFRAGQTDDRMDYVEWASLIQMADNLQERLRVLAGEG
jgi:predicted transcriptional regulator